MIRNLEATDYQSWLSLAREVEPLFGPMADSPEFCAGIKTCIQNRNAFAVETPDGILAGIIAISRENNEILWLAVANLFRGHHYGGMLVQKAIYELSPNKNIYVQTFAEGIDEGIAARILYKKFGFIDDKEAGNNPANILTVIMKKPISE